MLRATNYGVNWTSFPKSGSSDADNVAALLDVCGTVTSEMDALANQVLRATVDVEQEFGPDLRVTILPNQFARMVLSRWPIISLLSAQVSPAVGPPTFTAIPSTSLIVEGSPLPPYGTIVPETNAGPVAALVSPGYVSWANGRKGYLLQVTSLNGFPVAGMDQAALAGATSIHVDDITGWFVAGLGGARGTIFDAPFREVVSVTNATPDTAGAISGPGTLTLSAGLQFPHSPLVGSTTIADQRILVSAMPQALVQAAQYLSIHFGLIRGATAVVVQGMRGGTSATAGMRGAMDWYTQAELMIARFARSY